MMLQNKPDFQHPQPQTTAPARGQIAVPAPMQPVTPPMRVNFNTDIIGLLQTVSVAPTQVPNSPYQQIQIYVSGTTYRLYVYDAKGGVWHYATLT